MVAPPYKLATAATHFGRVFNQLSGWPVKSYSLNVTK